MSLSPSGLSALIRLRGFRSPNNDQAKWIVQDKNCQSKSDYYEEAFHLKKGAKFFFNLITLHLFIFHTFSSFTKTKGQKANRLSQLFLKIF